jgi:hypothetical protein
MDLKAPEIIALLSVFITFLTGVISYFSLRESQNAKEIAQKSISLSERANEVSINIARKQGVIELFAAWRDVSDINTLEVDKMIGPDILRSYNAMDLTAILWNHDVIQKEILFQQYWKPFRDIYDNLYGSDNLIPGKKKTCRSLIAKEHTKAYAEMKQMEMSGVVQTYT